MKRKYKRLFLFVGFFLVGVLSVIICIVIQPETVRNVTLEEICQDGVISVFGLDEKSTEIDFEVVFGQSYTQYTENLMDAFDTKDYHSLVFSFEGVDAILATSLKNDALQAIRIYFVDEELNEKEWKAFSDDIINKLKKLSISADNSSRYFFHNAEVWLEFGPVDEADYVITDDGTTAWDGIVDELGTRLTELRILFVK